jgi:hypothetical protein
MNSFLKKDKLVAALFYAAILAVVYSQVVFLGKSLIPSLYLHRGDMVQEPAANQGRHPANTFDLDISTPAFYEFPLNRLVGRMYLNGQYPLWNPHQGAGTPLAAQYSARAFFPYQVLEDILPYWTWDFFILMRLWIAGFFAYLFLRALALSRPSALGGGVFYMLSGTMVWFINLEQMANVAMMLPVLLFCLERLVVTRAARHVGWSALSFGLVLLAGQPEVALYVLLLAGAYFLFRTLSSGAGVVTQLGHYARAGSAFGIGLAVAAPLLVLFLELVSDSFNTHPPGGIMGVLGPNPLAWGVYILAPNLQEFPPFGIDLPVAGSWDRLGGYTGVLLVLFAFFGLVHGGPRLRYLLFFGGFAAVVLSKNFGIPPFIWIGQLPLFDQVWSNRWASPTWALALAVVAAIGLEAIREMLGSLGSRGANQEGDTLDLSTTRLRVVGAALLMFGVGLGQYTLGPWLTSLGTIPFVMVLRVLSLVQGIALGVGVTMLAVSLVPGDRRDRSFTTRTGAALTFAIVLFLLLKVQSVPDISALEWRVGSVLAAFAILIAGTVIILRATGITSARAMYALVALIALELWLHVPRGYDIQWQVLGLISFTVGLGVVILLSQGAWRCAAASGVLFVGSHLAIDLAAPSGLPDRANPFSEPPYVTFLKRQPGFDRLMGMDRVLQPNYSSAMNLWDVRYINALTPSGYHRFVDRNLGGGTQQVDIYSLWFTGSLPGEAPEAPYSAFLENLAGYSLLGVKYILVSPDTTLWDRLVPSDFPLVYNKEVRIYENPEAIPRAFIAHQVEYAASPGEAQATALEPDFDRRHQIVLEEPVGLPPGEAAPLPGSWAYISEYQPQKVVIEAGAGGPGVLVLTDTFYPGWKASVDGEAAPIYRVDGLFRGVLLSRGEHTVTMTYFPSRFDWGLVAAGLALAVCALLIAQPAWTGRLRALRFLVPRHLKPGHPLPEAR